MEKHPGAPLGRPSPLFFVGNWTNRRISSIIPFWLLLLFLTCIYPFPFRLDSAGKSFREQENRRVFISLSSSSSSRFSSISLFHTNFLLPSFNEQEDDGRFHRCILVALRPWMMVSYFYFYLFSS
jgi:hypothetical protein